MVGVLDERGHFTCLREEELQPRFDQWLQEQREEFLPQFGTAMQWWRRYIVASRTRGDSMATTHRMTMICRELPD